MRLTALAQLFNFLDLFALLLTQLSNKSQHSWQVNILFVKGLLNQVHCVFNCVDLALKLDQFVTDRVLSVHEVRNVVSCHLLSTPGLAIQVRLNLGALSRESVTITVDVAEAQLEIIDLIIEDFVVSVDSRFDIYQVLASLVGLSEVLVVQLVELTDHHLRSHLVLLAVHLHRRLSLHLLRLLLLVASRLLLLLVATLVLRLLAAPGLVGTRDLGTAGDGRVLGNDRHECARQLSEVGLLVVPLLQVGNRQHVLLAEVWQTLHDVHRELLVEVDLGRGARVVRRQDVLDWVLVAVVIHDGALNHQVIGCLSAREL